MIELALRSTARLTLIPAQDILGLGACARINTPGKERGNWGWQLEQGALDDAARRPAAPRHPGSRPRTLRSAGWPISRL